MIYFGINLCFILDVDPLIKMIPLIISIFLILPVIFISLVMGQIYTDKYFSLIKKSFILFTRGVLYYLLFSLGFISVFFITLIPLLIIKYILFVIYFLFIVSILSIGFICYNNYLFDKYINKEHAKSLYKLGLEDDENNNK